MRGKAFVLMVTLMSIGWMLTGCATYVNIPEQPGMWASSNPDNSTAQKIEIAALTAVLTDRQSDEPYRVLLPEGSSDATYNYVVARLPRGARPAPFVAEGDLYAVAGVFVRARKGQVDIVRPDPTGERQLVSVYLRYDLDGWYVERKRPWQIPLGTALDRSSPGSDPIMEIQPEQP